MFVLSVRGPLVLDWRLTVGFSCGAGAETLIFVTGTSGINLSAGRQTKVSGIYPENQGKQVFGYPVLRSKRQRWIPELRFGYPLLRFFFKIALEELRIFLESLGWSQRKLCITKPPVRKFNDWRGKNMGSWMCLEATKTLIIKRLGEMQRRDLAARNAGPIMTDPTPHSRPAEV